MGPTPLAIRPPLLPPSANNNLASEWIPSNEAIFQWRKVGGIQSLGEVKWREISVFFFFFAIERDGILEFFLRLNI